MKKHLLKTYKLGQLNLKNRVVMAPMTRARSGENRVPNELMAKYYQQRSGAGLIITEATIISPQAAGWPQTPGIFTSEQVAGWRAITESVDTPMYLQLWHQGRSSHSDFLGGALPVAPSAIKIDDGSQAHTPSGKKDFEVPRELGVDEIKQVVSDYQQAAKYALEAGFAGVEIHAANGYLIDQFLQTKSNNRQDSYGGTKENRYRFLDEVTKAVLAVCPADQVGVRLAPNGAFNDMGMKTFREDFLYFASELNKFELAYLHVMDGLGFGFHELGEAMKISEFRDVFDHSLIGNCGYTQTEGEEKLRDQALDLVAYGRPFISNPDLVSRFANDQRLADAAPQEVWYSHDEKGYADYPVFSES